ncbi:MAG TPA: hypothetical protein VF035_06835 [Longimicrobiales bacterium]
MNTVFLLSPASCAGRRAQILLRNEAAFPLAERLRTTGVPLGEAFSFLSGLYFRGKLAYATAFGRAPHGVDPGLVITTNRGLLPVDTIITHADLCAFGSVPIDASNPVYRAPLEGSARALREAAPDARVVLLGSIASDKYVTILLEVFGNDLLFPSEFVGRGDMSRGGLLLRKVDEGTELEYVPVAGAIRRGSRPPKLEPRQR